MKIGVEDFYRIRFISDLEPGKDDIYFVITESVKKRNDYESRIWSLKDLNEFTSGPRDSSPKISPDGKYMSFLRKIENKVSIMRIPLKGGESVQIAQRKDVSSLKWSKKGNKLFFISNQEEKSDDVKIIKRYPFYFNGKGFIYNKRPTLFSINLDGRIKKITDSPYIVQDYDVSINDEVAAILSIDGQKLYWNNLYIIRGRKMEKLPMEGSFSDVEFSPDGRYIAFTYSDNRSSIFQHRRLYIYDIYKKSAKCLTCDLDISIGNSINSDSRMGMGKHIKWLNDSLYFLANEGGSSSIFSVDIKKIRHKKILSGEISIDFFHPSSDGIYMIAQRINEPQEIYRDNEKLTSFNKYFTGLQKPRNFRFRASDGEEVEGWALLNEKRDSPSILEIHGGPKTSYGNAFMFEFYLLFSSGYNVIFMNPRGSDGYSEKFALQIKGHYGERDYLDIMEGLDYCMKNFNLDKGKLGVTGGSYGGFMTNWIIGHNDMFKAAVTQRSISNQISFFGTSDIGPEFNGDQIGGTPFDNIENYWEKSPLKYAGNVKTPLLIIHSDEDYRCPIEQAYQLFTALKFFNREVEMAIFPGENHDLSRSGKPNHRVKRLELIRDWFIDHLNPKD
ncbi:MAG: prolyl oligopeptidase family serine peptidase [Thermoplasmata archaeon]